MNSLLVYAGPEMCVVLQTYHSVFLAGMIATIYLAVELIASFPIGHMIDRMNSTTISMISSIIILIGPLLILPGYSLHGYTQRYQRCT